MYETNITQYETLMGFLKPILGNFYNKLYKKHIKTTTKITYRNSCEYKHVEILSKPKEKAAKDKYKSKKGSKD